eukprot:GHVR01167444.1.p1 GENE.GHVR01167444.1~~GHVR01167444.1.p1  ORF type:complete len:148 (+),score=7.98 GHVR01167444.1:221-664(+)
MFQNEIMKPKSKECPSIAAKAQSAFRCKQFQKKGQLPLNAKKQWKAIIDRKAYSKYRRMQHHLQDSLNPESVGNIPVETEKTLNESKSLPKRSPYWKEQAIVDKAKEEAEAARLATLKEKEKREQERSESARKRIANQRCVFLDYEI